MSAPAPKLKRRSLRAGVIVFLLLVLFSSLLLIVINSWVHYRSLQRQLEQDMVYLAERSSASALRVVDAQLGHLHLLSRRFAAGQVDRAACERDMVDFLKLQERYLAIGFADAQGLPLCVGTRVAVPIDSLADREWFQDVARGEATTFETLIGRLSRRAVLVAAMRVETGGSFSGVAFSYIDLDWIAKLFRVEAAGTDNMILVMIDARGRILAHTGAGRIDPDAHRDSAELWGAIQAGKQHIKAVDIDNVARDFYVSPIRLAGETRFYIASGIRQSAAADEAFGVLQNLLGPYLALTLLIVVIGFMLTERSINRPIQQMITNIRRYKGGDLQARVGPPYARNEFGELGLALDDLADAVDVQNAELKKRSQSVVASLAKLESLIAASPVPIVSLSRDWHIQSWNPAAERVFGYSAAEVIGKPPPIVPPDQEERSRAIVARVFGGETVVDVDLKRHRNDGHMLHVRASVAPFRDDNGNIDGAIVIFLDESERRQMEHQFVQAQKMEALGQLTGGLSHDFNNLLGVIIGNMDFLLDSLGDKAEYRIFVESALNAALQGAELNKRLLAFARRQSLEPEQIHLDKEIANIASMLKRTLGEQIQVETKVASDVWPVLADPSQLQAAILNLGINARDAMPEGGRLQIEVTNKIIDYDSARMDSMELQPGEYVIIALSDTGTGMPEHVLKRIFEPFFTTKEVGQGTGLGLSMVHGFAKQSGGHITCYSEVGRGSTFRLYLPHRGGEPAKKSSNGAHEAMTIDRRIRLLLVEDNAELRQVALHQLTQIGCEVTEAEDAASALVILRSTAEIDLMLSDIVMPGGMNGRELAAEATRLRPQLKIMLMSGYSDPRMQGPAGADKNGDAWPLLTKPFRRRELYEAVRRLLQDGAEE